MQNIEFFDKGFEKAVRKALKKVDGKRNITEKDILKISSILISESKQDVLNVPWISDADMYNMDFPKLMFSINDSENGQWLTDIMLFKHIKTLHIYIKTDDLSWLKEFNLLKELYVSQSNNKNWSFIENMLDLKYLFVSDSTFSDLSPIAILCGKQQELFEQENKKLKELEAEGIVLNLVTIIDKFRVLQNLSLLNCGLSDITPLAQCKYLSDLNLSHNSIADLSPLEKLNSIYYLTLRYNKIQNIEPLGALSNTYYINLRHNQITDISVFNGFENYYIGRLFIGDNPITDYTPLKNVHLVTSDVNEYAKRGMFVAGSKVNIDEERELLCKGILILEESKIQKGRIAKKLAREAEMEIYSVRDTDEIFGKINRELGTGEDYNRYAHIKGKNARINTSYIKEIKMDTENNRLYVKTQNSLYVFKIQQQDL